MEVIRRSWEEGYTKDNLISANSSSSRPRIIPLVGNSGGECILAGNLFGGLALLRSIHQYFIRQKV